MKLETKRLILREPTMKDARDIFLVLQNKNISKFMAGMPYPYKINHAKEFIKKTIESSKENNRKKYTFGIELKEEGKIVGAIGLHDVDLTRKIGSVSYWLREDLWGKGIVSEAMIAVLDFAFSKLKLNRINLNCNEKNKASRAIAKKFGFKLEGILRKAHVSVSTGEVNNKCCHGLLKEEWPKNKKRLLSEMKRK